MIQGFYIFAICCTDRESRELLIGMTCKRGRAKLDRQITELEQSSVIARGNISGNVVMNQEEYEIEGEYTVSVMNSAGDGGMDFDGDPGDNVDDGDGDIGGDFGGSGDGGDSGGIGGGDFGDGGDGGDGGDAGGGG